MADILSDAEKIRNKRLAKLQRSTPAQTEAQGSASDAPSSHGPSSTDPGSARKADHNSLSSMSNTHNSPQHQTSPFPSSPSAFAQIPPAMSVDRPPSRIRISPANTRLETSAAPISLESWEHKTLSSIFRISLDAENVQDANGNSLHYVAGVRKELEDRADGLLIDLSVIDQSLLEVGSQTELRVSPFEYFLACWKRVLKHYRAAKKNIASDPKIEILREARRLCMSYCIFAVNLPEMFGLELPPSNPLTAHLLLGSDDERGVCHEFLAELVSRFDEDDSARDALIGAIMELSSKLGKMNMNDSYKPYVIAMKSFVQIPSLVNALTECSFFLPENVAPRDIETSTLLGPFFHISPLQGHVTKSFFDSPKTRDRDYVAKNQSVLRMALKTHQEDLQDIVNQIIRSSKGARERMLDWFAYTVNSNHKRRGIQVDNRLVSSDAFMVNITTCLDQLCEPFMDSTFSKIDRIDVAYLKRNPRVNIHDETKLNADQKSADEFYSSSESGTSNFISEIFFLTLAAHHYGTEAVGAKLLQLDKDIKHIEKELENLVSQRTRWESAGQLPLYEVALKKYRDRVDKGLSYKYAIEGALLDELFQARSMQFMRYVAVWLLRLASPGSTFPKEPIQLPLPEQMPKSFTCLPEYYLEDLVSNINFIFRNMPHVVTSTQSDELVVFCITFLRSSQYVKNPYLKSKLVGLLFAGIRPTYRRAKGILGDILNSLPFALDNLLHSLLKFHIEVENTGAHSQFYDKFNIRYEIFHIIECIWPTESYRQQLSQESRVNVDFFVQFVNLLLNDATYVLDEALEKLGIIHVIEEELQNTSLPAAERSEKEEALSTAQNQARSYMQLTNQTVSMLRLFTAALADSFTSAEIVQRLADMLDYNLEAMVGPKSANLRVEKPESYDWDPKRLLSDIVDIYLNLMSKESFILAIARDGRSYKPENFESATRVLNLLNSKSAALTKTPKAFAAWKQLAENVKRAKAADLEDEENLGDIPDEFLDPILAGLMIDPVILPTSKVSIDRSTIRSHLLSDPNDPFNREPLDIKDVVPDVELKARIQAFVAERRKLRVSEADTMDTSIG
ncbi:MAG: hypothetical protein M1829_002867 [Trizodia sp. TS-e1964]|nr:MAG: hypothetical protein M1829_002867 [Trizodia sp. TS-e1964]